MGGGRGGGGEVGSVGDQVGGGGGSGWWGVRVDVNAMLGVGGDVGYRGCEPRIEGIVHHHHIRFRARFPLPRVGLYNVQKGIVQY